MSVRSIFSRSLPILFGSLWSLWISCVCVAGTVTSTSTEQSVVRMGIVAYTYNGRFTTYIDHEDAMQAQLPKLLAAALPDIRFETKWYRQNDLARAIAAGDIDVFLGSSGFYWEMRIL